MSSSPEFVRYLCEQLEGTGEVRFRKMFGEYWIYLNDRPPGGKKSSICPRLPASAL